MLKDFDIATAAGGPGKAVIREIEDIEVTDDLVLQLVPRTGQPLLSAIEVRKTR